MDNVYLIEHTECREGEIERISIDSRWAFTSRKVADMICQGISMFRAKGDESEVRVVERRLYTESTFEEWNAKHGPGAQE